MLRTILAAKPFEALGTFAKDESGATAIEYGLICALIFLAIVSAVYSFADSANSMFTKIKTAVQGATH